MSWDSFFEGFASAGVLSAMLLTLVQMHGSRTYYAAMHYLNQCDVALREPQFSNPTPGTLDLAARTFDGEAREFERYEWYVARLVYALDAAIRLAPFQQWAAVAKTQLANHRGYFASDYYARQDYLQHYSTRMRRMIQQARAGA